MRYYILLALLFVIATTDALSCRSCKLNKCRDLECPGSKVMDPCGCCEVCAKQVNQTCGGMYNIHGVCEKNLLCVVSAKPGSNIRHRRRGVCREETPDCKDAICDMGTPPKCPDDSAVVEGFTPRGQCCPLPARCECKPKVCKQQICHSGRRPTLVRKATGVPGLCCDVYRCDGEGSNCDSVRCAPVTKVTCPRDSSLVKGQGSTDGCCEAQPRCECDTDKCESPVCGDGKYARKMGDGNNVPGSCCDSYQCVNITDLHDCYVNDHVVVKHGDTFPVGKCDVCSCTDGEVHCAPKTCPKLRCAKQYTPPGGCCPKCKITILTKPPTVAPTQVCYSDGRFYDDGEQWKPDDCTKCVCVEGEKECVSEFCQTTCAKPRKVPGVCCGVCDEPTVIEMPSMDCPSMEGCKLICDNYWTDSKGCKKCECTDVECPMFKCIPCPYGYERDENGCQTCTCKAPQCKPLLTCSKRCIYGHVQDKDGCYQCECNVCDVTKQCDVECEHGYKLDEYGCNTCECNEVKTTNVIEPPAPCVDPDDNVMRQHNEIWESSDGHTCTCKNNMVLCDALKCPQLNCLAPLQVPSSACPVCNELEVSAPERVTCKSLDLKEGSFYTSDDNNYCGCVVGSIMCARHTCPIATCENPKYINKYGCKICDEGPTPNPALGLRRCVDREGVSHAHDSKWLRDKCVRCECIDGSISCMSEQCDNTPLIGCKNSAYLAWKCCPGCLDIPKCYYDGVTYTYGEKYYDGCHWVKCGDPELMDVSCEPKYPSSDGITQKKWFPYAVGGGIVIVCVIIMIALFVAMCKRGQCSIQTNMKSKYTSGIQQIDSK